MKRKILLFGIAAVISLLSATAQVKQYDFFAPNQRGDTLYYVLNRNDSGTVSIAQYHHIVTDTLFIPAKVSYNGKEYAVTELHGSAFAPNPTVIPYKRCCFSHVVIPEGIRKIGSSAFNTNDSLFDVFIPSTCEGIGIMVFNNCPRLRWVDFSRCSWKQMNTVNGASTGVNEFFNSTSIQFVKFPLQMTCYNTMFYSSRESTSGQEFSPKAIVVPASVDTVCGLEDFYLTVRREYDSIVHILLPSKAPVLKASSSTRTEIKFPIWYPCGSDSSYLNSWITKKHKNLHPGLFLENGYKDLDSVCPAKCYRAYGFRPDSVGVWIVKKKSPNCDCDSLNIYIVRSLLPDATVNDSSINVEPNREDTSVVWTWEGTGVEYDVYREEQKIAVVTEPYYRDTDIMPGVQYCYNFVPINAYGCEGEWSGTNCYTMVFDDGIGEHTSAGTVTVRPNPATGRIFIDNLPEALQGAELVVYDATGREVLRHDYTPAGADVSALSRGIYFLRIGSLHGKFVKM